MRIVFGERSRTEVAPAEARVEAVHVLEARTGCHDGSDGFGNIGSHGIELGEARMRPRRVEVEGDPRAGAEVVRPFEPVTAAGPARLRDPFVAGKHQLRVEIEHPDRRGRLEM